MNSVSTAAHQVGEPGEHFQIFGDSIYFQPDIVNGLRKHFNVTAVLNVFRCSYAAHHGTTTVNAKCARDRMIRDYHNFRRGDDLPYYVVRTYDLLRNPLPR